MKIGILTHYYNSRNYGGTLQAYALTHFLIKNGYETEQICYQISDKPFSLKEIESLPTKANESKHFSRIALLFRRIINSIKYRLIIKKQWKRFEQYSKQYFEKRFLSFVKFRNQIPHSDVIYNIDNICDSDKYDCYIVGSDQIWNFNWFNPAFFLEFVNGKKGKIAYAASAGKSIFSDSEIEYLQKVLPSFDAISVREKDLQTVLPKIEGIREIEYVLDPVFLLDINEWDSIASERLIKGKYVFCFFLGNDIEAKKLAKSFAKRHRLKFVFIPYDCGHNDFDYRLKGNTVDYANPNDFISLIKNADYVFTDSFHATAFSAMYGKQVFVFDRINAKEMGSRIISLAELLGFKTNICNEECKRTLKYIESLSPIKYQYNRLSEMKEKSIDFLLQNISAVESGDSLCR